MSKPPTKRQIAKARKWVRENTYFLKMYTILQMLNVPLWKRKEILSDVWPKRGPK